MAIIIGSDHAAYSLKEIIKAYILSQDVEIKDVGAFNESSIDYSDIGSKVARMVSQGKYKKGVLLCGTGLGMSMVANRFDHVRAALCNDLYSAKMSRYHNNSNILVMGGRVIGPSLAVEIVKSWMETPFEGGRHNRRLQQFDKIK